MTATRPVVLVTGANGFVGRHLSAALEAKGWTVRRAQRMLTGGDHEVQIGAIGPQTDWRAALDGVAAVVHLAARVHHPNEENAGEIYRTVNTEGTLQLARSPRRPACNGSSISAPFSSTAPRQRGAGRSAKTDDLKPRGVYGLSKAAAESGLEAIAGQARNAGFDRSPAADLRRRRGREFPVADQGGASAACRFHSRRSAIAGRFWASRTCHPSSPIGLQHRAEIWRPFWSPTTSRYRRRNLSGRLPRRSASRHGWCRAPELLLRGLLKLGGRAEAGDSLIGSLEIDMSKALASGWRPELSQQAGLRLAVAAPVRADCLRPTRVVARSGASRSTTAIAPMASSKTWIETCCIRVETIASAASTRLSAKTSPTTRHTVNPLSVAR